MSKERLNNSLIAGGLLSFAYLLSNLGFVSARKINRAKLTPKQLGQIDTHHELTLVIEKRRNGESNFITSILGPDDDLIKAENQLLDVSLEELPKSIRHKH